MSKKEVEDLNNADLLKAWDQIKTAYKSSLPKHLSNPQSLILFADFVNVSGEISKRKLEL